MKRIFRYGDQEFPDPGSSFTNEMVRQQLVTYFPELAQATSEIEEKDGTQFVTFRKQAGRKGLSPNDIIARLEDLPAPDRQAALLIAELERLEQCGQLSAEILTTMQAQIGTAIGLLERHIKLAQGVTKRCLHLRPVPSRRLPAGF